MRNMNSQYLTFSTTEEKIYRNLATEASDNCKKQKCFYFLFLKKSVHYMTFFIYLFWPSLVLQCITSVCCIVSILQYTSQSGNIFFKKCKSLKIIFRKSWYCQNKLNVYFLSLDIFFQFNADKNKISLRDKICILSMFKIH